MRLLILLTFTLACASAFAQKDFYKIKLNGIKGEAINMEDLRGKMVLIVNTASDSSEKQLAELDALEKKLGDSGLVILAIPSNDFGNEKDSAERLNAKYNKYNFKVAARQNVKGPKQSDLYQWLTQGSLNGITDNPIHGDFKKFLINRKGRLVGAFHERSSLSDPFFLNSFSLNK